MIKCFYQSLKTILAKQTARPIIKTLSSNQHCFLNNNYYYFSGSYQNRSGNFLKDRNQVFDKAIKKQCKNDIKKLLDMYRKYQKDDGNPLNIPDYITYLRQISKTLIHSPLPKDQSGLQELSTSIVVSISKIIEHIDKISDISVAVFLSFVCVDHLIRKTDTPDQKIMQLFTSKPFLKQLTNRFTRFSLKNKSLIIKFINIYHKDILQCTSINLFNQLYQNFDNHIHNTIAQLTSIEGEISPQEMIYFWRDVVNFREIKQSQMVKSELKEEISLLGMIYKNMESVNCRFLWIFMRTTSEWIVENLEWMKFEITWKREFIYDILQKNLSISKNSSNYDFKIKYLECLAIMNNMEILLDNLKIKKSEKVTQELPKLIKKAYENIHADLLLQIKSNHQKKQAKIDVIKEFQEEEVDQESFTIEKQQQKLAFKNNLSPFHINMLLETMIETQHINHELYETIDKIFFNFLSHKNMSIKDIESYLAIHNRFIKVLAQNIRIHNEKNQVENEEGGVSSRLRGMKKEQGNFILRVIQGMRNNEHISASELIHAVQRVQKGGIQVKSRKIKRQLLQIKQAWSHAQNNSLLRMKQNQKILLNLLIDNF